MRRAFALLDNQGYVPCEYHLLKWLVTGWRPEIMQDDEAVYMTAKEAKKLGDEFNATLRADHPGFGGNILIISEEHSVQFLRWAFYKPLGGKWGGVFSEHQGWRLVHEDDDTVISLTQTDHDWWKK